MSKQDKGLRREHELFKGDRKQEKEKQILLEMEANTGIVLIEPQIEHNERQKVKTWTFFWKVKLETVERENQKNENRLK